MVDPEGLSPVSVGGVTALAIVVQDFLKRVAGPVADELGDWLRDQVRTFRHRNLSHVAASADALLRESGIDAQPVPMRTLLQLLEGASREDQEELQQLWASLLANAAAGDRGTRVLPSFPILLAQLSRLDARVLECLADARAEPGVSTPPSLQQIRTIHPTWGISIAWLGEALSAPPDDLEASIDTLLGLGLLHDEPDVRNDWMGIPTPTSRSEIRLSTLGQRFVAACQPPVGETVA